MFRRTIIALCVLLFPLGLVVTEPAAGASVAVPTGVAAHAAAAAVSQPVLRLGSRGSAVTALQQRLIALHYFDVAAADGVFGQNTYHAVIAFQKVQGLTRDDVAGPATWAKLAKPYVPAPRYKMAAASLAAHRAAERGGHAAATSPKARAASGLVLADIRLELP